MNTITPMNTVAASTIQPDPGFSIEGETVASFPHWQGDKYDRAVIKQNGNSFSIELYNDSGIMKLMVKNPEVQTLGTLPINTTIDGVEINIRRENGILKVETIK